MESDIRVGVYVCHCGSNIAGVIDTEGLAMYAATLPNVVVARDYLYMCSAPGQQMIKDDARDNRLTRVVLAACSPKMHEVTFMKAIQEAGLNPYLVEIANIREHCAWVHSHDPVGANRKARSIVKAAVAKAALLEPLEEKTMEVGREIMVIGGGVAGMTSALDLGEKGFMVHLVEKSPTLGGRAAYMHTLFPTRERAVDLTHRLTKQVGAHPNVEVLTNSEVTELTGYVGNFKATVRTLPRKVTEYCNLCGACEKVCPVEVTETDSGSLRTRKAIFLPHQASFPHLYTIDLASCTSCGLCVTACQPDAIRLDEKERTSKLNVGAIIVATGFDTYTPPEGEYGYGLGANVLTMPQLQGLMARGELNKTFENLQNVVFISCVGSRQNSLTYKPFYEGQKLNQFCSRVCCTAALTLETELRGALPDARIFHLYRDLRTHGRGHEKIYEDASRANVFFMRYDPADPPRVEKRGNLTIVTVKDELTDGEEFQIRADLVVLSVGMQPRKDAMAICSLLRIPTSLDGFVQEAHPKLRPLEAPTEGIYLAGAAQGPKDITESTISGSGAASKAVITLNKGWIKLSPIVAHVDDDLCNGCALCVSPCVYDAIGLEEKVMGGEVKLRAVVNEAKCQGCGVCAATCPSRAVSVRHFSYPQLEAVVNAFLSGD